MKILQCIFPILVLLLIGCDKEKVDFVDTLPECKSTTIFTHLPIQEDDILRFIPLGNYNPPGHTFPTSHHYFDIQKGKGNIPVYAPFDGWMINVSEYVSGMAGFTEYAFEIVPCKEIKVKYGHISQLDQDISSQLGSPHDTETYTTGGVTYTTNNYKTEIAISAGQQIGEVFDIPEVTGIDFGMIDTRVNLPFINPSRFDQYGYVNAVSFLDYSTQTIKNILYQKIQFNNGGYPLRTTAPLAGEICYDVAGTVQGLWFKPGEPTTPEDPHLSLIKNNFKPEKNVFSVGTSVNSLPSTAYEFLPVETGTHNRAFDQIADDQIYSFSGFTNIWGEPNAPGVVILLQLVDGETMRIEKQTENDGPPWSFTNKVATFKR